MACADVKGEKSCFQIGDLLREGLSKDEGNSANASPNISCRLEYSSADFHLYGKLENGNRVADSSWVVTSSDIWIFTHNPAK